MATAEEIDGEEAPPKKSKLPLIIGLVLALAGGGGGFYAIQSGMILGGDPPPDEVAHGADEGDMPELPDVAFVPLEPMVISVGDVGSNHHLRFRAQLETPAAHREEVEKILPRIVDVLNGYLRAVEVSELADRAALTRLRAQMLRRVQIVTGKGRVRDLLVMEFVVN